MQSYIKKTNGNLINICNIRYYRAKDCTVYEKEHKKRIKYNNDLYPHITVSLILSSYTIFTVIL